METLSPRIDNKMSESEEDIQDTPETLSIGEEMHSIEKHICPVEEGFNRLELVLVNLTEINQVAIDKAMYYILVQLSPEWDAKQLTVFEDLLKNLLVEKRNRSELRIVELCIRGLINGLEVLYPRTITKFLRLVNPLLKYYHQESDSPTQPYFFLRLNKAFNYAGTLAQKKIKKKLRKLDLYKKFEEYSFEPIIKRICSTNARETADSNFAQRECFPENPVVDFSILKSLTYSYPVSLFPKRANKENYFSALNREYFNSLNSDHKRIPTHQTRAEIVFDDELDAVLVFYKKHTIEMTNEFNK